MYQLWNIQTAPSVDTFWHHFGADTRFNHQYCPARNPYIRTANPPRETHWPARVMNSAMPIRYLTLFTDPDLSRSSLLSVFLNSKLSDIYGKHEALYVSCLLVCVYVPTILYPKHFVRRLFVISIVLRRLELESRPKMLKKCAKCEFGSSAILRIRESGNIESPTILV